MVKIKLKYNMKVLEMYNIINSKMCDKSPIKQTNWKSYDRMNRSVL